MSVFKTTTNNDFSTGNRPKKCSLFLIFSSYLTNQLTTVKNISFINQHAILCVYLTLLFIFFYVFSHSLTNNQNQYFLFDYDGCDINCWLYNLYIFAIKFKWSTACSAESNNQILVYEPSQLNLARQFNRK